MALLLTTLGEFKKHLSLILIGFIFRLILMTSSLPHRTYI